MLARRIPLRLPAEAGTEPIEVLAQPSQQRPRGPRRHPRSVQNSPTKYKPARSAGPSRTVINLTNVVLAGLQIDGMAVIRPAPKPPPQASDEDMDLDREIEYAFDADEAAGLPRGLIGPDSE